MSSVDQRQAIRDRLAELEAANGGRLTPEAVVNDARDPASPLHDQFEWDTAKAAYAYWIEQARALITSVRVVVMTDTATVSTINYIRDPTAGKREQGYVSVKTLRSDADLARDAIVSEFSRVADMLRRARELATVLNVERDVDRLVKGVTKLRDRVSKEPRKEQ